MKQPSMASDLRTPEEEDNESMADYADGVGDGEMIIIKLFLLNLIICHWNKNVVLKNCPKDFCSFAQGNP